MANYIVKIKNTHGSESRTWAGQLVEAQAEHQIASDTLNTWRNDEEALAAILSGEAEVGDGVEYFSTASEGMKYFFGDYLTEVLTQKEKGDVRTNVARAESTLEDGQAEITVRVPGVFDGIDPDVSSGRFIEGGEAFFDSAEIGDVVSKIEVKDNQNILGYGAGFVIATYHDKDVDEANQGWYIPKIKGYIEINAMAMFGFIPAGMDLVMTATRLDTNSTGIFFTNIKWGARS